MSQSPLVGFLGSIRSIQRQAATALTPFALLLARVVFGYGFYVAGKGKLDNPERVAGFFGQSGIPAPEAMVYVTAYSEILLGWMLVLGLATRFASAGIMVVMTVAFLAADRGTLSSLGEIAGAAPVPYFMVALLVGILGAGWLSLDHVLDNKLFGDDD